MTTAALRRDRSDESLTVGRQVWLVVGVFILVVACVLYFAYTGLTVQSWLRAYAASESMWSKAQKGAVIQLHRYAATGEERLYYKSLEALRVPQGDGAARLELERRTPDLEVVFEGFLQGRNHPEDVPGLAKLFRRFRTVTYVDSAVAIWEQGDVLIGELSALADSLHAEIAFGGGDASRVRHLLEAIDDVDARLTPLEEEFTQTLSEGGRWLRRVLLSVILLTSVPLVALAALWAWILVRRFDRADAARRRSEAAYRSLVEGATHGILRATPEGAIVSANPALWRMLGYRREEDVLGLRLANDVYREPGALAALVTESREVNAAERVEAEWRRRDGRAITVQVSGRALRDDHGHVIGVEVFAEDVTERRQLEDRLRQSQKIQAVEQLTGGIAHDLNNLLTAILANADLLAASTGPLAPDVQENLDDVREAARRGASMVRKLLAFSRRERLSQRPLHLGRVLEEEVAVLRRLLPESISLELDVDDQVPLVRADAGAIQQILVNLTTNARDAMPHGGRVRIECGPAPLDEQFHGLRGATDPGAYVRLTFADTGGGMDIETRRRAFEPFFTTKPLGAGSGLGLSAVYGLVKQHGGFIELESAPQTGTTVTTYLPIARPGTSEPDEGASVAATPALPNGTETVLVVEDEEVIRRSARRVLQRLGYRVLLAEDGAHGLELFLQHSAEVDLAVIDVVMPRMTGPALYAELRRLRPNLKVLFMSGYTEVRERGPGVDADSPFLDKPWSMEQFAAKVREVLDGNEGPDGGAAVPDGAASSST